MNLWKSYTRLPDGSLRRNLEHHDGANGASGPAHLRGQLVVAEPGWRARTRVERLTANQTRPGDRPVRPGRPRKDTIEVVPIGRGRKVYATEEERIAARRLAWRESARRRRERREAA